MKKFTILFVGIAHLKKHIVWLQVVASALYQINSSLYAMQGYTLLLSIESRKKEVKCGLLQ